MGLVFLTGIVGGIFCLAGRDFRYPVFGKWLERYLTYDANPKSQMDEEHEENWVAGICHATIISRLWGIVTPLVVWFTQKERSARLRFQAMQAVIYQGTGLAAYLIGIVLYMVAFFGMMFMLVIGGVMSGGKDIQGPGAVMLVVFFGVLMLFWFLFAVILPIYYLLGGFAGLRLMQGHPFRYPILGKIIEKRMETSQNPEPMP